MLVAPENWFARVPGVRHTGPLNVHFVRDVGCAYLALAVALSLAARGRQDSFPLLIVVSTFLSLHALLHVWARLTEQLPSSHLLSESLGIFLPAVVVVAVTLGLRRPAGR